MESLARRNFLQSIAALPFISLLRDNKQDFSKLKSIKKSRIFYATHAVKCHVTCLSKPVFGPYSVGLNTTFTDNALGKNQIKLWQS